ncbi:hypothetical protein IWX83_002717 [Flavobacterium sp. CG_9.1]|uniref:hypothetical protein n=1 Tax=Flavobacterium sp. CG_9.1 TaxID=2787728 RepID=UPI0018CBE8AC|nr:hypothetical protein [Flavobacterium sp. CG_9.1]MBG6062911.1 hypothetical protein [Flavobacterium sp. CG_9.1]
MEPKIKVAKAFHDCKAKAIDKINTCFHPDCSEKSISSHILQKNGILSSIAEDGHVIEMQINKFNENVHSFRKIGINKAFSFNCFCSTHDTELFKTIEVEEIDFSNYRNLLLFTLRTVYNEKFRKLVNVSMYECLIANHSDLFDMAVLNGSLSQEKLGINDLQKTENVIWKDLNNSSESYVFKVREISIKGICLSAFYNYETSLELQQYIRKYRKDKEDVSDIFVNLFPNKDKSVFMMAYKKENESDVKAYVNEFFTDSEKRLERKITNLMMFQCETWVISNNFYSKKINKNEGAFSYAASFSCENMNERKFFDLNIFHESFANKYRIFKKNALEYLRIYGN